MTAADDAMDDDGESVVLGFGATLPDAVESVRMTDASVDEGGGQVAFTTTLSEANTATVTVDHTRPDETIVQPGETTGRRSGR